MIGQMNPSFAQVFVNPNKNPGQAGVFVSNDLKRALILSQGASEGFCSRVFTEFEVGQGGFF